MMIAIYSASEIFSKGLRCLLKSDSQVQRVDSLDNPDEILNRVQNGESADLLVLDLDDFQSEALHFVSHLKRLDPNSKILILGSHTDGSLVEMLRLNGANGYVEKNENFENLNHAIDQCSEGKNYFPPTKTERAKHEVNHFFTSLRDDYRLSDREMEVMQLIFCQQETNEIAEKLNLSPHTIRTHRKRIYKKLKIHNLSGLLHLMP